MSKNSTIHALGVGSDFSVQNGGSVCILRAHSDECQNWIDEHVGNSETQRFGGGIVVEPRYIGPLIEALESEGFTGKQL